jgi:hypothetical protein
MSSRLSKSLHSVPLFISPKEDHQRPSQPNYHVLLRRIKSACLGEEHRGAHNVDKPFIMLNKPWVQLERFVVYLCICIIADRYRSTINYA